MGGVALALGSAAIMGAITVFMMNHSSRSSAWIPHGFVTAMLVLAAGMALGPRQWQQRGINVVAWLVGSVSASP
ncbi:MAG: hypothetical protein QM589_00780 [Thermomicrobiales bacterium]